MEQNVELQPAFLALVPVLNLLGLLLKRCPKVKDERIPLLLGVAGAVLASLGSAAGLEQLTPQGLAGALFGGITQGLLAAGSSVYVHQLYLQDRKSHDDPPLHPKDK